MTSLLELAEFLAASPVILVADTDPQTKDVLLKLLSAFDCDVHAPVRPSLVINKIISQKLDLVFVDLAQEPFDVVRTIKTHRPETPIVALADTASWHAIDTALAYGTLTLMRKPVDLNYESLANVMRLFKIKARTRAEVPQQKLLPAYTTDAAVASAV